MEREELRQRLLKMSDSELRHRDAPGREQPFDGSPETGDSASWTQLNGQVRMEFTSDLRLLQHKNRKFSRHAGSEFLDLPLAISQHTRYSRFPIHVHDYVEANYVYAGRCEQIINGQRVTLHEGDLCILDTNVSHTILDTTEDDVIVNFIMLKSFFNSSFLSRLAGTGIVSEFLVNAVSRTQNHNRYILFHTGVEGRVRDTVENLMCEYFDPALCSKEIFESYLVILFSELLRTFRDHQAEDHDSPSNTQLIEILKYLEEHYRDCTLAGTAERFSFHPNYLSAYLRKSTGRTFKELVQIRRMTMAGILLSNSSRTVQDVASEVGYNNLGFFYKKFAEHYGQSPGDYRQRFKSPD